MVSIPGPLLLAVLIEEIKNSVEQGGGGVSGRHPVNSKPATIKAAVIQTVLLIEDIIYLQIGLITFLYYENVNNRDKVTTGKDVYLV
jgi:hypothetical protein